MKNVFFIIAICLLSATTRADPSVTILANSIDLALSKGYVDNLQASGINVTVIPVEALDAHKEDSNIIILGGQNAPDGVGPIVGSLLTDSEEEEVLASTRAKTVVIVAAPWAAKQKVMIFAGYEKEQTRKAFGDAQGDVMKSLRFDDALYPQNYTETNAMIPSIDPTQPFTEVSADEAYAIIKGLPGLVLMDVRGRPFYDAGHIPGAVSMPEREFARSIDSLDKTKTYLLYCGGNSESIKAGNAMAEKGFKNLYRLVDGYVAWRKAGYPKG